MALYPSVPFSRRMRPAIAHSIVALRAVRGAPLFARCTIYLHHYVRILTNASEPVCTGFAGSACRVCGVTRR